MTTFIKDLYYLYLHDFHWFSSRLGVWTQLVGMKISWSLHPLHIWVDIPFTTNKFPFFFFPGLKPSIPKGGHQGWRASKSWRCFSFFFGVDLPKLVRFWWFFSPFGRRHWKMRFFFRAFCFFRKDAVKIMTVIHEISMSYLIGISEWKFLEVEGLWSVIHRGEVPGIQEMPGIQDDVFTRFRQPSLFFEAAASLHPYCFIIFLGAGKSFLGLPLYH